MNLIIGGKGYPIKVSVYDIEKIIKYSVRIQNGRSEIPRFEYRDMICKEVFMLLKRRFFIKPFISWKHIKRTITVAELDVISETVADLLLGKDENSGNV